MNLPTHLHGISSSVGRLDDNLNTLLHHLLDMWRTKRSSPLPYRLVLSPDRYHSWILKIKKVFFFNYKHFKIIFAIALHEFCPSAQSPTYVTPSDEWFAHSLLDNIYICSALQKSHVYGSTSKNQLNTTFRLNSHAISSFSVIYRWNYIHKCTYIDKDKKLRRTGKLISSYKLHWKRDFLRVKLVEVAFITLNFYTKKTADNVSWLK